MTQLSFDENAIPQTSLGEIVVKRTSSAGSDLQIRTLTDEQEQAVARRSEPLLLAAGAGSGKTSVLVERFVRAVREDGIAPGRILAITFTERAAGELRERVRRRFAELDEREAARDTEMAFVSTFHGFCARLLRAHPLFAGLDPEFAILDEGSSERLRGQAWASALGEFLEGERSEAVDLVAAWGADRTRAMVEGAYAELRSKGERRPMLPLPAVSGEPSEVDAQGARACALLGELLEQFVDAYELLKSERGSVDFDDLELGAKDLLDQHEGVRQTWSQRFELMMVDEFQDTNPRQLAILEALERGNLFTVGDELQSIYGFRHADVSLFGARRDKLAERGGNLSLRRNFRGRKPLLDAVNVVFGERFGDGFTPLQAGRLQETVPEEPIVELMLTHKRGWDDDERLAALLAGDLPPAPLWRQAEARLLAQRVAELVESGEARAGDVAVLLRAVGDLEVYERALQEQGLSTLATVGGFWGRQQVGDLVAYLRVLANPLDELALYGTLASPLVGVSSDGLALLGATAKRDRRSVWETLGRVREDHLADVRLPVADRALLVGFRTRIEAERSAASRRTISQLIERALDASGYLEHVLSLSWPERRLANVHKLLRVARRYEASEGRDLRGFLDHVVHQQDGLSGAEPDAPVADAEFDAVRLMSIHAAKGLEFGVVCVADLGRAQNLGVGDLLVDNEEIGLRLARLDGSEATPSLAWVRLCEESKQAQADEEDRILYVAMTRARERLLLSGAVDLERWPEQKLGAPAISWLGPALLSELPAEVQMLHPPLRELAVGAGEAGQVRVGLRLNAPGTVGTLLRLDEHPSDAEGSAPAERTEEGVSSAAREIVPGRFPRPEDNLRPSDSWAPETLNYTELTELARCGYRFYLERVLRLPELPPARAGESRQGGLEARARGTIVHRLLESLDFLRAAAPSPGDVARVARELGVNVASREREELAALLCSALQTPFAVRLAAAAGGVRREYPFAFSLDPSAPLLTGVIDLLARESSGGWLVVDYKSDRVASDEDLGSLVEREYSIQRLLYALAVLRDGAPRVEIVHWFLHRPSEPICAVFSAADKPQIEETIGELIRNACARPFIVSKNPHRGLCLRCPGRSGLCSWSESDTLRERVGA
jgi:ATP-dependent exoDNAse (exonuclease V) beta subunit